MMYGIPSKSYDLVISSIANYKEIDSAILFGSRAMGTHKRGSDIDIAIKGKGINAEIIAQLKALLNEGIPIPHYVDVVHYSSVNDSLRKHIDQVGKNIYKREN